MDIPGYQTIRRIVKQVKLIIEYLPVLWQDRHWDYGYLFYLMDFKLNKMEQTIIDNDIIEDAEQTVKSIRVFRKLFMRSYNEEWHVDLQQKILERTWGKSIWWEPQEWRYKDSNEFDVKNKDGKVIGQRWYLLHAPYEVIVNNHYKEYNKEYFEAMKKADKKASRDLKIAFKVFTKYHKTWFD